MKKKYEKSYNEKIGKIHWDYRNNEWVGKLVGAGRGCQVNLRTTILVLLRDLLRQHADGIPGCPHEWVENGGDVSNGRILWAQELRRIADLCDFCQRDDFIISKERGIEWEEASKEQEKVLCEIMDWLKENLYTLWW